MFVSGLRVSPDPVRITPKRSCLLLSLRPVLPVLPCPFVPPVPQGRLGPKLSIGGESDALSYSEGRRVRCGQVWRRTSPVVTRRAETGTADRPCGRAGAWLRRRRGAAHGGAGRAGVRGSVRPACGRPIRTAVPTVARRSGGARITSRGVGRFVFREFLHLTHKSAIGGWTHIAGLVFRPFAGAYFLQLFTSFGAFHGASSCVHFVTVCRELRCNGAG